MTCKPAALIALIVSMLLILPCAVSADGMIFHIDDEDMWGLLSENQQLAAINYENGVQNMILAVDVTELSGEKAVWLFPVPAKPDETAIDIIQGFPRLWGSDIKDKADTSISSAFMVMRVSQVYTFPLLVVTGFGGGALFTGTKYVGGLDGLGDGVIVHEHIEKMGLVTELVSAKESGALYSYLTGKGLDLPANSKAVLDEYTGKDYSFVVSWISDVEAFKLESSAKGYGQFNTIGVSISFPTDKIYFPLKPTSVYGSAEVPVLIYVMEHVTPELYPGIEHESTVTYFDEGYYSVPTEFSSFFNGKTSVQDLRYTKIKITAPSKYLTEDLWIKNSAPSGIALTYFIIRNVWIVGIAFFVVCSCLASLFSGMIVFRKDQISKSKLFLLGLANFFTLIGFTIATIILETKKLDSKLLQQLNAQGITAWDNRKVLFIFLFTILFLALTIVFQLMLQAIF